MTRRKRAGRKAEYDCESMMTNNGLGRKKQKTEGEVVGKQKGEKRQKHGYS